MAYELAHCEALNHLGADYCQGRPIHMVPVPDGLQFVCAEHLGDREPMPVLRDQAVQGFCAIMPLRPEWLEARE